MESVHIPIHAGDTPEVTASNMFGRCRPGIDCDSYKLKRLAPKVPEIASNRTETLDEALYGTLLSV